MDNVPICKEGGTGIILPVYAGEYKLNSGFRTVVYGIFIVYCFLGVSIVADIFMSAIEEVTNRRRKVRNSEGVFMTVYVWNETVANLSLMALGSSAPEISLSVIELFKKDMFAGDLGSSTIVGSAAFNLLVIVATCIYFIPDGEDRQIKNLPVFYLTAVFSFFAYLWMVLILSVSSPDVVDITEAVLTFAFLPVLIWSSYTVDLHGWGGLVCYPQALRFREADSSAETKKKEEANHCPERRSDSRSSHNSGGSTPMRCDGGNRRKSIASHHMQVMHSMSSSSAVRKQSSRMSVRSMSALNRGSRTDNSTQPGASAVVQFLVDNSYLSPGVPTKKVSIVRAGSTAVDFSAEYGVFRLPLAKSDDSPCSTPGPVRTMEEPLMTGVVQFGVGEMVQEISVSVGKPEPGFSKDVVVRLISAKPCDRGAVTLGTIKSTVIHCASKSHAGVLAFLTPTLHVTGQADMQMLEVLVLRRKGCSGDITCNYRTERLTAVPGYDFEETDGIIEFQEGVTETVISLNIPGKQLYRAAYTFLLILQEPEGGAAFNPHDDGGEDTTIMSITVGARREDGGWARKIDNILNFDGIRHGNSDWRRAFCGVLYCNGSAEAAREAALRDHIFHYIVLPWKLVFVLVPPTSYGGGWVCFYISLLFIAIVTALLADLADLFGCVLDIPEMIVAITFVALGTSMPDLFASLSAATEDETADASIVNVTGSNSVNVFLGLGLPWTIAAFYWALFADDVKREQWTAKYPDIARMYPDMVFVVDSKNLGFSVLIFAGCCGMSLLILLLRRRALNAELGGPVMPKIATSAFFVLLWFGYVILASWQALRGDDADISESLRVIASVVGVEALLCCWPVYSILRHWKDPRVEEEGDKEDDDEKLTMPPAELSDQPAMSTPETLQGQLVPHVASDEDQASAPVPLEDVEVQLSTGYAPVNGKAADCAKTQGGWFVSSACRTTDSLNSCATADNWDIAQEYPVVRSPPHSPRFLHQFIPQVAISRSSDRTSPPQFTQTTDWLEKCTCS